MFDANTRTGASALVRGPPSVQAAAESALALADAIEAVFKPTTATNPEAAAALGGQRRWSPCAGCAAPALSGDGGSGAAMAEVAAAAAPDTAVVVDAAAGAGTWRWTWRWTRVAARLVPNRRAAEGGRGQGGGQGQPRRGRGGRGGGGGGAGSVVAQRGWWRWR